MKGSQISSNSSQQQWESLIKLLSFEQNSMHAHQILRHNYRKKQQEIFTISMVRYIVIKHSFNVLKCNVLGCLFGCGIYCLSFCNCSLCARNKQYPWQQQQQQKRTASHHDNRSHWMLKMRFKFPSNIHSNGWLKWPVGDFWRCISTNNTYTFFFHVCRYKSNDRQMSAT